MNLLALDDGEWSGYPMPVDGLKLVVEPRHPMYETLNGASMPRSRPADPPATITSSGKVASLRKSEVLAFIRWHHWMLTLSVAADQAWSVEAELAAVSKLRQMITAQQFKTYMLAGAFCETSPLSGMHYIFRKLRPTIAIRQTPNGNAIPVACLCLHPIAYYEGTWAGALVPTDDVIAHLMLMRGDERRFWGKANHHDMDAPESGI